jgi:hypothetical protein
MLGWMVTQVCMSAQNVADNSAQAASRGNGRAIEGVWDQSVTVRLCDTGDPIGSARSMSMFNRGGTLTETSNSFFRGPSLGTWLHVGGRNYATAWKLFRFGADGSYAGSTRSRRTLNSATTLTNIRRPQSVKFSTLLTSWSFPSALREQRRGLNSHVSDAAAMDIAERFRATDVRPDT